MSLKVTSWVFESSETTGNDRLILLAIADEADDDGTNAFPSIDRISRKARVPSRTVQRCLARLEEAGDLIVIRPEQRGRGHFNTYRVVMKKHDTLTPFFDEEKGRKVAEGGTSLPDLSFFDEEKGRKVAEGGTSLPDLSYTHRPIDPEPPPPAPPRGGRASAEDVTKVWDAWRASTGRKNSVLDKKRKARIEMALRVFPLDDVLAAVDGWKHSPHHRGENDRATVYNDLELILRDASNIEKFRDLTRGAAPKPRSDASRPVRTTWGPEIEPPLSDDDRAQRKALLEMTKGLLRAVPE